MVITASAGWLGPEVGLAIIRVTTTDFTAESRIASVEVEVYGSGSRSSPSCSSVCASTSRVGVSTTTLRCRRTSSRSNVGSWWTKKETTCSPATAASTPSATTSG